MELVTALRGFVLRFAEDKARVDQVEELIGRATTEVTQLEDRALVAEAAYTIFECAWTPAQPAPVLVADERAAELERWKGEAQRLVVAQRAMIETQRNELAEWLKTVRP